MSGGGLTDAESLLHDHPLTRDCLRAERAAARADKRLAAVVRDSLESLDLLCRAEDTHGDTIRAHEVRGAVADLRAALTEQAPS